MKKYYPKLRRLNHGAIKRKHGIVLTNLYPEQQNLLTENEFLKEIVDDDQVVYGLFKLLEIEQQNRKKDKLWYNPYTDTATTYKEILEASEFVDWTCAICKKPIKSNMTEFTPENFVCEDCQEAFTGTDKIDVRITKSSLEFTLHCKRLLILDQRDIIKSNNKAKHFINKTYKI